MRPQVVNLITKVFLIKHHEVQNQKNSIQADITGGDDGAVEQSARIRPPVLAKYVFDKWKLTLPILKRRNQMDMFAKSRSQQVLKSKVFAGWRDRAQERQKWVDMSRYA